MRLIRAMRRRGGVHEVHVNENCSQIQLPRNMRSLDKAAVLPEPRLQASGVAPPSTRRSWVKCRQEQGHGVGNVQYPALQSIAAGDLGRAVGGYACTWYRRGVLDHHHDAAARACGHPLKSTDEAIRTAISDVGNSRDRNCRVMPSHPRPSFLPTRCGRISGIGMSHSMAIGVSEAPKRRSAGCAVPQRGQQKTPHRCGVFCY